LVAISAVYCAAAAWIVRAENFESWRFPFLFMPSTGMMGIGIIGSLVFCIVTFIASGILVMWRRTRPLTSLLFFGCVVLVFVVEESAFLRLLLVMLVSAVAFLAETLLRRLAISHVIAGALAIAFTGGFYFLVLFGLASGGV
jgi:hypothetical protein